MAQEIQSTQAAAPSNSAPSKSTSGATQPGAPNSSEVNSSTTITSLEELKSKAPEVWQKMLEGIGMNICNEMRRHEDRIKELRRQYEQLG